MDSLIDKLRAAIEAGDRLPTCLDDGTWETSPSQPFAVAHRKVIDAVLAYEAKIDGEWGCCHSAEDIGRGKCPDAKPEDIPGLLALAEGYDITVEEPVS